MATSQPLLPPKIVPGVLEIVSEALYSNRWLDLDYRNAEWKTEQGGSHALGPGPAGAAVSILFAAIAATTTRRNLALHRILSAEVSTLTFVRPKDFDLRKYDDDGRFGFGEGEKVRLVFYIERSAGMHLMESPLSTDQQVVEHEDGHL
ncbi:MAG: WYL domain-containing protein, partial [Giesbergeria sp.]